MSASRLPAASHTKSIHLLRALLREATYLPDAAARHYFRTYIVDRFRAYQPKQNATTSLDPYRHRNYKRRQLSIITERTSKLQKKAQKGLHYLRRANQGELPCLQKVLLFTYGRLGKRKYALLHELLKPNPIEGDGVIAPPEPDGPTPLQELYYSNKQYLQYFDAPKPASNSHYVINISDRFSRLRVVLKSQHQRGISLNREIKSPAVKTPIHNIWMRPMPIARARNNVRRWYAETMTRLLPPLPPQEWDNLHAMIHGQRSVSIVNRRAPATCEAQTEPGGLDAIEQGLRLDKLSKADRPAGMWRPHNISPKFMRRMYWRLLQLCCKVEYDSERKEWAAIWGESVRLISPKIYHAPSDASLFDGVDANGKIPQPLKESKRIVDPDRSLQPRDKDGEYVRFPFFTEFLPPSNPLRKELDAWKKRRLAAGIIDDGSFRGR
jgi:hypothetical protein